MRKFLFFGFLLFGLFGLTSDTYAAGCTGTGNCYWVGGTGNSNDTTKWATTDGGATTGGLPSATDNCNFTANSSAANAAYTFTVITSTLTCLDFVMAGPGASNNVTWAGSVAMTLSGSMNLSAGSADITRTYTGTITFNSTTAGKTVDTNGVTLASPTIFNGVNGEWTYSSNFNSGTSDITLTNGSLYTSGKSVTGGNLSSLNSNVRTLSLATSTLTLTQVAITATNLTFYGTSSVISLTGGSAGGFAGDGLTFNNVTIAKTTTANVQVTGTNIFNDFTITGPANATQNITFTASQTINGVLRINGNSVTNRIYIRGNTIGTAQTFTAASTSISNADFRDITGAGAGNWNLATSSGGSGDVAGNSGITFTPAVDQHWIRAGGAGGNWSGGATNWTTRTPLPQDNVFFDNAFGTSQTITTDMPRMGKSIDWTGATWTTALTWGIASNVTNNGSLTLVSGLSMTGTGSYTFEGRDSYLLDTKNVIFERNIIIDSFSGTTTLASDLTTGESRTLTFTSGTFDAGSFNLSVGLFSTAVPPVMFMRGGVHSLTGAGTVFSRNSSNITFNQGTSTLKITNASTSAVTFSGAGYTYYNLLLARGTSTGTTTLNGSNTFNEIRDTGTVAHTIIFTVNTVTTVTTFAVSGSAGARVRINSTTAGVHSLVKTGGGTVCSDYLDIQHSSTSPASTWYAGANSVNNQAISTAGSGWLFTACPSVPVSRFNIFNSRFRIEGGRVKIW